MTEEENVTGLQCQSCMGNGSINESQCSECKGSGEIPVTDEYIIHSLMQEVKELKEQNEKLTIDRDEKEIMINTFDKISKLFDGYQWIKEGRGSYDFNDDEYRLEVTNLFNSFKAIKEETWKNIKTYTTDYKKALMKDGFDYENQMLNLQIDGLKYQLSDLQNKVKVYEDLICLLAN